MAIEAITGLIDCLLSIFYGWRFLLSRTYRARKLASWKSDGIFTAICEVVFGIIGILLTLGIMSGLAYVIL